MIQSRQSGGCGERRERWAWEGVGRGVEGEGVEGRGRKGGAGVINNSNYNEDNDEL
jgi:hypothetical protein